MKYHWLIIAVTLTLVEHSMQSVKKLIYEAITNKSHKEAFKLWHYITNRPYDINSELGISKYRTFKSNRKLIVKANQSNLSYTLGLNHLSDMTFEEFKSVYLMKDKGLKKVMSHEKQIDIDFVLNDEEKSEKDWSYLYQDVEDQGFCGSCWAFSIVGVIEGLYNKQSGKKEKLSKKYVVDCDSKSEGCDGGWFDDALNFIKTNGIYKENDYTSYNMRQDKCLKIADKRPFIKISGYSYCKADEKGKECKAEFLDNLIETGPFGTYIDADDNFMFFSKGIWKPTHCHEINHAVIVVSRNKEWTKIRNSWGDDWGELGYGKIARGKLNDLYGCGAEEFGFAPLNIAEIN